MQTDDDGMRELAQVDKKKLRQSSTDIILLSTVAMIAAMQQSRLHPGVARKIRLDRSNNIVISGKNRKNSAQAAGRRSVMRMKLAAKREKAKRRLRQERVAAGGAR